MPADTPHIRAGGTTQPGWTHQSVWISTENGWNRWVGPRESNLRYRQCNKCKPKKRQCVPNMTASELSREVRENTHKSQKDSVVPVCVFFIGSFFCFVLLLLYFNGTSQADRDHHSRNAMSELKKRDLLFHCSVCLFWRPAWQQKAHAFQNTKDALEAM